MAWSSGFFNSLNGDRTYNAQQMSDIFKGLITDGVYESVDDKLVVQPNTGMAVQIGSGRGWFGGHWIENTAEYPLTIEAADVTLNRYAAIIIRVDETTSVRSVEPVVKYSAVATAPVKPTMERSETVKEYCLAYVYIKAGAREITAADIEDARGDTSVCGWVTGLIDQVDTKTFWEQWSALFNDFMADNEVEFTAWFDTVKGYLDEDVAAKLTADVLALQEKQSIKSTGILTVQDWTVGSDGRYTQTIEMAGVTDSNDLMVTPADGYMEMYNTMGCEAISQGVGVLTFRCGYIPDYPVDIPVEVIIFNL